MARATIPLNFNAFLEKAKLKDDSSNYMDWVYNLRIILIAAQKNYVLEASLGARPAAGATPDVMNVWQSKADDYLIVQCAMLYGLEPGLQRRFERHGAYEMFQELKLIFQANARVERYEVSNKFFSFYLVQDIHGWCHIPLCTIIFHLQIGSDTQMCQINPRF